MRKITILQMGILLQQLFTVTSSKSVRRRLPWSNRTILRISWGHPLFCKSLVLAGCTPVGMQMDGAQSCGALAKRFLDVAFIRE